MGLDSFLVSHDSDLVSHDTSLVSLSADEQQLLTVTKNLLCSCEPEALKMF